MANTAVKVSASPNELVYLLTGDGEQGGPILSNATVVADMVIGPLRDAWTKAYTSEAVMRLALLGFTESCLASLQMRAAVAMVTGQINQIAVNVSTDAPRGIDWVSRAPTDNPWSGAA